MTDLFLFRTALRDLLRFRRLPLYALLALLPAGVALVLRFARGRDFDPAVAYNALSASLIFGFLLVILSVVFGTGVVAREVEQKTIVYLLTRPVPRWRILLTRFLAAAVATTLTVWAATGLLALATWQPGRTASSSLLTVHAIRDWKDFGGKLRDGADALSQYLAAPLDERAQRMLYAWDSSGQPSEDVRQALVAEINDRLRDPDLYNAWRDRDVRLSKATSALIEGANDNSRPRVNLAIVRELFPGAITPTAGTTLTTDDLADARVLANAVRDPRNGTARYILWHMRGEHRDIVTAWDASGVPSRRLQERVVRSLNQTLRSDRNLFSSERFGQIRLENQTRQLAHTHPTGEKLTRLNRWLIEEAYPDDVASSRTARSQIGRDLLILPVGALSYASLFMLLATLVSRALIGGLIFAFGWESWVPLLPGNFKLVSLMTYLRVLAPHPQPPAASVDITEILSALTPSTIDAGPAWAVLFGTLLVCAAGSVLLFSRREYVPRDDVT